VKVDLKILNPRIGRASPAAQTRDGRLGRASICEPASSSRIELAPGATALIPTVSRFTSATRSSPR